LLPDAEGSATDNPMVQVQPLLNCGTTKKFSKSFKSLSSLVEVQSVGEHYRFSLQALWGTDKARWQSELDLAIQKIILMMPWKIYGMTQ
jgi:hypothetical protein